MSATPVQVLSQPHEAVADSQDVDLIEVVDSVRVLLRAGARPLVVHNITGASHHLIRNEAQFEGVVLDDRGGRRPRSLGAVIESVDLHIEASLFLLLYLKFVDIYKLKCDWGSQLVDISEMDVQGTMVRGAFIRALQALRSISQLRRVTVDHARLIALAHSTGEATLTKCTICPTHYLRATSAQTSRTQWNNGDCPLCRKIVSLGRARSPARITDKAVARAMYARISGSAARTSAVAEPADNTANSQSRRAG